MQRLSEPTENASGRGELLIAASRRTEVRTSLRSARPEALGRDGSVKWDGGYVFIGEAYRGELLGFQPVDDGVHHVFLGPRCLGALSVRARTVVPIAEDVEPRTSVTDVPGQETT